VRRGEPVAGLGGAILFASLFLRWYDVSVEAPARSSVAVLVGLPTGWEVFTVIDVLLALAAAIALAVPLVAALSRGPAAPIAIAVIASTVTPFAVVLVIVRMLFPPGITGESGFEFSLTPATGAWLSLAGALLAFAGSWLSMRDESTPGAMPPDLPRRPAPPNITD
jgi:hypothetical protein